MGIGGGYCEGNLNFATASEDDEVYTKKKVSRVSFRNAVDAFNLQFPLGNRRGKERSGDKIRGYHRYLGQQRGERFSVWSNRIESNRLDDATSVYSR